MKPQSKLISDLFSLALKKSNNVDLKKHKTDLIDAFRIRQVELKFLELFSDAKISGTVHTCVGQELTGVVLSKFLTDEDWVTSNHRCHGHYISRTKNWQGLIDELVGLESGVSKGIGSSQHLLKDQFISNGTQGSLLPVATGIGLSVKRRQRNGIVVSFVGEGTLGEGVVYETFNLAALFQSPHLIICENNYYSQTTPQAEGVSGKIIDRAKAFGWAVFESNTWDLDDLNLVTSEAVEYVRTQQRPAFLKIDTYRLLAHSKGDDDRTDEEVSSFFEIDLVTKLEKSNDFNTPLVYIKNEIDSYVDKALIDPVKISYQEYARDELPRTTSIRVKPIQNARISMVKALSRSYRKSLEKNDAIFIGEDIADPYGGAFKITKGFQDSHPNNVFSTSISEAGLVGMAIGMNLDGCYTFAEIMFGDFILNAMDQIINNASKFHHMYGKQISSSVVIRTPMGGRRGYGPTHSQSLEKFLLGIDNTMVVAVSSLSDPGELINDFPNFSCPKIVIENKTDYSSFLYKPREDLLLEKMGGTLGTIKLSPRGGDTNLLIIAYGYVARLIADNYLKIFTEADCVFTLMCPQLLHPIPFNHFERAAINSRRVLLIEESTAGFGWVDGVAATFAEMKKNIQIARLSSDPVAIPSNREVEELNLVSIAKIIEKIRSLGEAHD
jgi:2-oxoisovalerate dehydrogenase E1 component